MTLRLTVAHEAWRAHLAAVRADVNDLVPVVKGNGYGLGRSLLADTASTFAAAIAVGTVHELHDVGAGRFDEVLVLTPALQLPAGLPGNAVPTVGNQAHVDALVAAGWRGPVNVKVASAMHRYGVAPGELAAFVDLVHRAGFQPRRALFHPPLVTAQHTADDVVAAIEAWLTRLDPALTVSTSHLDPATFTRLTAAHPGRRFELRLGTALWHGDKSMLHLDTDVLDTHPVAAGTPAGYRCDPVPSDGTLVMIGAGSAHGVAPLADGRSPFHFARRRLSLHEAPHMHTSMAFVPAGEPCPAVGDRVDVQRPLITTAVDEVVWA